MRKNLLTKKGEALVEYIKSGARNNPEFEQTLLDVQNIIKEKQGVMPTNESVRNLLLELDYIDREGAQYESSGFFSQRQCCQSIFER